MSKSNIEKAIDLLKNADSIIIGGVTSSMIQETEKKLGVTFPPSYVLFLKELGYCMLAPYEFEGIPNKPNYLQMGVAKETLDDRADGLPAEFVVIFNVGEGTKYLINTAEKDSNEESPIYSWIASMPFKKEDVKKIYNNYGDFLLEIVEETLKAR